MMLRAALILSILLSLAGCATASLPGSDTPAPAPVALIVSPTSITSMPLPRQDAERVFHWPAAGTPSLIFVYDDGEG